MAHPKLVFIVHNVRSAHNVGSILRSADAFLVDKVYLTGYTPYPKQADDTRLPHLAEKIHKQIAKTALGVESTVETQHQDDIFELINKLRAEAFNIVGLEQAPSSIAVNQLRLESNTAIIVGREVEGIEPEVLAVADKVVEIAMSGAKESLNVAVAAAITMYQLRSDKVDKHP